MDIKSIIYARLRLRASHPPAQRTIKLIRFPSVLVDRQPMVGCAVRNEKRSFGNSGTQNALFSAEAPRQAMKVLRFSIHAVIGALHFPALALSASAVRGGGEGGGGGAEDAGALAPMKEQVEMERGVKACVPDPCLANHFVPYLQFTTVDAFMMEAEWAANHDDGYFDDANFMFPTGGYDYMKPVDWGDTEVCESTSPTVLYLGPLEDCKATIGSIKFELFEDGKRIRRFTEKQYPFTVFGDTVSFGKQVGPLTVNGRVLPVGSNYHLAVTVKDRKGCVSLVQAFEWTVTDCADDYSYDDFGYYYY